MSEIAQRRLESALGHLRRSYDDVRLLLHATGDRTAAVAVRNEYRNVLASVREFAATQHGFDLRRNRR